MVAQMQAPQSTLDSPGDHLTDEMEAVVEALWSDTRAADTTHRETSDESVRLPSGQPSDDPVAMYFAEISTRRLLTAEEEIELGREIQRGQIARARLELDEPAGPEERALLRAEVVRGQRSRQRMIEANLRLVVSLAKKYQGRGMPLQDLIQEGNIGLIRAVEKFDYRKGFRFTTYAVWGIRQTIQRSLATRARIIHLPVHTAEETGKLICTNHRLSVELGREPTRAETADAMGVSVERVHELDSLCVDTLSLDQPLSSEDEFRTLGDVIEDPSTVSPAEHATQEMFRVQVAGVLDSLTPREKLILRLRFGFDAGECRTLQEVGLEIGLTRERVRQIETRAILKLRYSKRVAELKSFLDSPSG